MIKPLPSFLTVESKQRFLSSIDISLENRCWEWNGEVSKAGYGVFYTNGNRFPAHRISVFIKNGHDPKNNLVLHSCDNRKCVNPDHLYIGNQSENIKDMHRKGRGHRFHKRGEECKDAKLKEQEVLMIRAEYRPRDKAYSLRALAKRYRVANTTIGSIVKRKTWTHI